MARRVGFWVGVGVAMAAATISFPLQAQTQAPPVVSKPADLPPDLAFGRSIALIRGHLLAGDELVKHRAWNLAYPHFTFPSEEIYGVIRDDLHGYKTPQFDVALKALARTVRARDAKQYPKAWEKVAEALAKADAALKAKVPNWPRFEVAVAVEVLKAARDEYEEAIANGRIAHAVGYRTARGFIRQAERMIENAGPALPADNAVALADIRAGLEGINPAFTSIDAPDRPTMDVAALAAAVAQIEMAAGKLPHER
jgi:hypothetical protein